MTDKFDFERYWLAKLAAAIDAAAGEEVRKHVLAGSDILSDDSPRKDVLAWTREAMTRLEESVDAESCRVIMAGCACEYPVEQLVSVRSVYEETGDIADAHRRLQDLFEEFLRGPAGLDDELIKTILDRGWGLAGELRGDTVIVTKIPKSGNLREYFETDNPERRRALYCHCPRIRAVLEEGGKMSPVYCYCGAGFYKRIWEEIIREPVEIELLESVLDGGEVCRVAVRLPPRRSTGSPRK